MRYELDIFTYVCRHTNHVDHDQKDQGLYSPTILQNVLGVVLYLTLSQTTNFRLFETERDCRLQFQVS